MRERIRQHAPALHDAAVEALTPEQRKEGEAVAAGRKQLAAELGDRRPGLPNLEQRAAHVGLSFLYDVLYRYESSAGPHPTMMAVDLLLEKHPKGLVLRGEPTAQFVPPPVYLHGAYLLYEALKGSGELTPALNLPELPSLGRDIDALVQERTTAGAELAGTAATRNSRSDLVACGTRLVRPNPRLGRTFAYRGPQTDRPQRRTHRSFMIMSRAIHRSLVVRGPAMKDRFLVMGRHTGETWWQSARR